MGFKKIGYDQYTMEEQYTLVCDECGKTAHNPRADCYYPFKGPIPWLLEKVQKFGWVTRRASKRGAPLQWVCLECRDKMKSSDSWWGESPKAAVRA